MQNQPAHSQIPPCPHCGGKRVGGLLRDSDFNLHKFATMKQKDVSLTRAYACTACGYIALYVDDLQELAQALQQRPGEFLY